MPYSRQNAPSDVPDRETLEFLLGEENTSRRFRHTKTFNQLTAEERAKTGLAKMGVRSWKIPGDPFGFWGSGSGNVDHSQDIHKAREVIMPLCEELVQAQVRDTTEIRTIQSLLQLVPNTPIANIPTTLANQSTYDVARHTSEELVVTVSIGSRSVRLMQCYDLDVTDKESYDRSTRAKLSHEKTQPQHEDPPMTLELTRFVMAHISTECLDTGNFDTLKDFHYLKKYQDELSSTEKPSRVSKNGENLQKLRQAAQEKYWLYMSPEERKSMRQRAIDGPAEDELSLKSRLAVINNHWNPVWNSDKRYPDLFRSYVVDQRAAKNVWEHVQEDIFVVVDKNNQVVFANIEHLAELLLGKHTTRVMERCMDVWSFFIALKAGIQETRLE